MSDLGVRVISAVVLLAVGFGCLLLDSRTRWGIIAWVLVTGAWELSRLLDRKYGAPDRAWLGALVVLAFALPYFPGLHLPMHWNWAVAIAGFCAYVLLGFRRLDIEVLAPWLFMNGFVAVYMGLWGGKAFALTSTAPGWMGIGPFALTIACIAAADSGAYFAGRAFGRHKLSPHISPKKTVEGAVGGALASMAIAAVLAPILANLASLPALALGAALAGCSILGDLLISALKRFAGAKDTSRIIPGHGGVMDRFDSLVFAGPIAWLGLKLAGSL